jgi:hypothetical protein
MHFKHFTIPQIITCNYSQSGTESSSLPGLL